MFYEQNTLTIIQPRSRSLRKLPHFLCHKLPQQYVNLASHLKLYIVSDIAIFVLKRDVKLQLTNLSYIVSKKVEWNCIWVRYLLFTYTTTVHNSLILNSLLLIGFTKSQ